LVARLNLECHSATSSWFQNFFQDLEGTGRDLQCTVQLSHSSTASTTIVNQEEGMDVEDYLTTIVKSVDELSEAGVAVTDPELVMIALNSLGPFYNPFVTTHTASASTMSFPVFQGLLREYDAQNAPVVNGASWMSTANYARGNNNNQHSNFSSVVCQICYGRGHIATGCFNRHNESRFPSTNDRAKGRPYHRPNSTNAAWYDMGCTDHITQNPDHIQNVDKSPTKSAIVTVNGEVVPFTAIGSSTILCGPMNG